MDPRGVCCGQTPLSLAAKNEHDGVAELILGRGDVSPDRLDKHLSRWLLEMRIMSE